jgi:hypothetical protein
MCVGMVFWFCFGFVLESWTRVVGGRGDRDHLPTHIQPYRSLKYTHPLPHTHARTYLWKSSIVVRRPWTSHQPECGSSGSIECEPAQDGRPAASYRQKFPCRLCVWVVVEMGGCCVCVCACVCGIVEGGGLGSFVRKEEAVRLKQTDHPTHPTTHPPTQPTKPFIRNTTDLK